MLLDYAKTGRLSVSKLYDFRFASKKLNCPAIWTKKITNKLSLAFVNIETDDRIYIESDKPLWSVLVSRHIPGLEKLG